MEQLHFFLTCVTETLVTKNFAVFFENISRSTFPYILICHSLRNCKKNVLLQFTTDRIFKKRGYEKDEFLFRTVIKIRKIQFTQFLHTSASKFFLRALPRYYMLQPMLNILFYIALLSFYLDFRAGNLKFQRPKIPACSA